VALPDTFGALVRDKDPKEDPYHGGSTRLVLARQRLASEAANLEAGGVGDLGTVGRPEEDPIKSVISIRA
jgi:hypothetical protein